MSKRYAEDKKLAKEKQGRKGLRNGRVKPIALYNSKGELIKKFDYIKLLCEYLIDNNICTYSKGKDIDIHIKSVRSQINRCLQNGRLYKKMYRFKLI